MLLTWEAVSVLIAFLGCIVTMWVMIERRLTRIETDLRWITETIMRRQRGSDPLI